MDLSLWFNIYDAHKVRIYSYMNIVLCSIEILVFYITSKNQLSAPYLSYRTKIWLIYGVSCGTVFCVFRICLAWMLFFAQKNKHRKKCQFWCLCEVGLILISLIFILTGFWKLSSFNYVEMGFAYLWRVYGLWIIYSFSLETMTFNPEAYFANKAGKVLTTNPNSASQPPVILSMTEQCINTAEESDAVFLTPRYYLPPS